MPETPEGASGVPPWPLHDSGRAQNDLGELARSVLRSLGPAFLHAGRLLRGRWGSLDDVEENQKPKEVNPAKENLKEKQAKNE